MLALVAAQRRFIYPVPGFAGAISEEQFHAVELATDDGLRLHALYRPAAPGHPTIVFFHGNANDLRGSLLATRDLAGVGYGVLLPEYRGYGGNPGSPSEAGFYADGRAALGYLKAAGVADRDIVLVGNSLGSGVAAEMAVGRPVRALVIVSGYTSLPAAVAGAVRTSLLNRFVFDRFDTASKLPRIGAPILILHGDADRVISVEQGRALHRMAPGSTYREIHGAGHQLVYEPQSQRAIAAWLAGV